MTETKIRPELTLIRKVCNKCGKREFEMTSGTGQDDHTCLSCV